MRLPPLSSLLVIALLLPGCPRNTHGPSPISPAVAPATKAPLQAPAPIPPAKPEPIPPEKPAPLVNGGQPQEGLPMRELVVAGQSIRVEVAGTPRRRQIGLMFRMAVASNRGMIFVYPSRRRLSFWMKNTLLPLSIAYLSDSGEILQILEMIPATGDHPKLYPSTARVRYALEMNSGWFQKQGIKVGAVIHGLDGLHGS